MYYPGAILEADSVYVNIQNQSWFYGMFANTCDSVYWNVIANSMEISTEVEFSAYPSVLNCENNIDYCIEGDTINFTLSIIVENISNDIYGIYPNYFSLHQNYPNPFNPTTTIKYELPIDAFVNIKIYDLTGRLVKTLINRKQSAGYKEVNWSGIDNSGKPATAGLYLCSFEAGGFRHTKKMVLLK